MILNRGVILGLIIGQKVVWSIFIPYGAPGLFTRYAHKTASPVGKMRSCMFCQAYKLNYNI